MFFGTIRDNITMFNHYDEDTVHHAICQSGLEKLVNSLPNGLDTIINENGNLLSGGEKRRISIVRSLIKGTPILVLDEPNSALDKKTSDEIERVNDCTCIMVTHKLNNLLKELYENIIYLEDGKLQI